MWGPGQLKFPGPQIRLFMQMVSSSPGPSTNIVESGPWAVAQSATPLSVTESWCSFKNRIVTQSDKVPAYGVLFAYKFIITYEHGSANDLRAIPVAKGNPV